LKLQPAEFPFFFYGTLQKEGKYFDAVKPFLEYLEPARTYGLLYYNEFLDENGESCVTAAFNPEGPQQVQGQLFHPKPEVSLELQSILDEFEFNFHKKIIKKSSESVTRDRVYLRNIITCTNQNGESYMAWCYLYHSKMHPLSIRVEPKDGIAKFEKISPAEFLEIKQRVTR
jgi:hypothetical protein